MTFLLPGKHCGSAGRKVLGGLLTIVMCVAATPGASFAAEEKPATHHRHHHHRQKVVQPAAEASPADLSPAQPQPSEQTPKIPPAEPAVPAAGLPSSLPLKRDTDASAGIAAIPVAMLSGIALLGAMLIAVRYYISKKPRGRKGTIGKPAGWFDAILPKKSADDLRVLSSVPLSRTSNLHVIEWRGSQYLLAGSEHAFTVIERLPEASGKAAPAQERTADLQGAIA